MEFRSNNPLDDRTLGRKAQSNAENASNKTGVEGAALLFWMITGAIFFLFAFAPLVIRLFFRKHLGTKSFGIIAVIAAYFWTRVVYILTILNQQPCEVLRINCDKSFFDIMWLLIMPFLELVGLQNTGNFNLGEFRYPWNFWNSDYPSLLPLYGTVILIFGILHYLDYLFLPLNTNRSFYSRGENAFTEIIQKYLPRFNKTQIKKYGEPIFVVALAILAYFIGDWRFAIAICFALMCLKFEELWSFRMNREVFQSAQEGKRKGEYMTEFTENNQKNNQPVQEDKDDRSVGKI